MRKSPGSVIIVYTSHLSDNESLKFDNVGDGCNNFTNIVYEVADGVLGRKVRNTDKNIIENDLSLVEKRRNKRYLRDGSYENKRSVRRVEDERK